LHPIANSQDRDFESEQGRRNLGSSWAVDRVRSTREYDTDWIKPFQDREGRIPGQLQGVYLQLSDCPGDQLGILGSEIQDED
jgi:hypothetical protein